MAKQFPSFAPAHLDFILKQTMYFVATATEDSRVNLSPKGLDTLRVITPNRLIWLNLTGSGNESAAHVAISPRMTVMFCSFEGSPLILRAYGSARVVHPYDEEWAALLAQFPVQPGPRQVFDMTIDLVQTSCGFGVPLCASQENRTLIDDWAEAKGADGVVRYWEQKNQTTIDGLPTHVLQPRNEHG